ncbi:MAG: ABC transporter permease subunit [Kiritimatiellae bacterium]|nr:ABC transporter permease subunit [Kiritimatiellia bacterium]
MNSLRQMWRVACYEWFDALRSRRALVVLLLYMAAALCNMHWSINLLHKLESELATVLQLPQSESTGVVSTALWKSKPFQRIMRQMTQNDAVLQDITGKHPVELIYAWFAFFYTPLLVVLVAGNRIAEDLGSGTVRYMIFRISRASWTLGKFLGQTLMIGFALILSGVAAYAVARYRLAESAPPGLFANMLQWSARAWIFSIPYLGLAMGLSHLTRSASKATVMGIIAITFCFVATILLRHFAADTGWRAYLPHFGMLLPDAHKMCLWRSSPAPLATGSVYLLTLGFCYLLTGYAFFRKRDA